MSHLQQNTETFERGQECLPKYFLFGDVSAPTYNRPSFLPATSHYWGDGNTPRSYKKNLHHKHDGDENVDEQFNPIVPKAFLHSEAPLGSYSDNIPCVGAESDNFFAIKGERSSQCLLCQQLHEAYHRRIIQLEKWVMEIAERQAEIGYHMAGDTPNGQPVV